MPQPSLAPPPDLCSSTPPLLSGLSLFITAGHPLADCSRHKIPFFSSVSQFEAVFTGASLLLLKRRKAAMILIIPW